MTNADAVTRGRQAFAHKAWGDAYAHLTAADRESPLDADPVALEQLALSAYLTGRDKESDDVLARAHTAFLAQHEVGRAVRCAVWLAFGLLRRGEQARGSGWIARARRLLDEHALDCVERGYLLIPEALRCTTTGEWDKAQATFAEAAGIGERFGDRDLMNLGRQGRGRALIRLGEIAQGVALFDEVMVAVTAGETSAPTSGLIYCSVIAGCFEMLDLRRAREWTTALGEWCTSQPDLVPYRGDCLIHRAEILALQGAWPEALEEAQHACDHLSRSTGSSPIGSARYQLAEMYRLRGDFDRAEEIYRDASQSGRMPQPGLALLRLAQGRVDAAKAAICRVLDEPFRDRRHRSLQLAAAVEILLASDDVPAARRAADELLSIATVIDTPYVLAMSAGAMGSLLLTEGDARSALAALREALTIWRDLDAPYEAARVCVSIGLACCALGDVDSAQFEFDSARAVFRQLGAAPDLARVDALALARPSNAKALNADAAAGCGLTSREVEVLRLVASGKTNRAIADDLGISEKTVARHIANIFTKLDLSSRAAATAYAFQHKLV
jgi:DNA-binding CsgD family transcriptional regulator